MENQRRGFERAQDWYEQTTEEISDLCYNFDESFLALKNIFDKENFKVLCERINELAHVIDEYKTLKDDFLNMGINFADEIDKKFETELAAIRFQQAQDRAFMESKFAEILERLSASSDTASSKS